MIDTTPSAFINVLPSVGSPVQIYMTVILSDHSLNEVIITNVTIMNGNVTLPSLGLFLPKDGTLIALLVTGMYNNIEYIDILYTKAIFPQVVPDNFQRLVQAIPQGVFTTFAIETPQYAHFKAVAEMMDEFYQAFFFAQNQVFSLDYSQELEYEYNGTRGILSTSLYINNLFYWFSSLNTVAQNTYDLELAVSQYIYYRIGISCPVYINDHIDSPIGYWNLGVKFKSELDHTAILAPNSYNPFLQDLQWIIYNSGSFTDNFKSEIIYLIQQRLSRADIGNPVTFSSVVDPVDDDFELIGYTYPLDPRLLYLKCIQYNGINQYPLNITGYKKVLI